MSGTLGRYRLIGDAGERPAGALPAEDTLLERRVDLLVVPQAAAADPPRLARIRQEIERAAAFVHPDVAAVYGLEEGGGRLFATLEPAAGGGLDELLTASGGPSLGRALEIARTLVDVLEAAREDGLVHGGLHPGDVRLSDDGSVTLAGFGLHELRQALAEERGEAAPGAGYRPPLAAPGVLPDHSADLHALGRLVEELLAAAGPPPAGDDRAASAAEELRRALARFVAPDPAARPRSAGELRPHLEKLQRALLAEARESPAAAASGERRRPLPPRWLLAGVAALLALAAGWGLWRGTRPAEPPAPRAEAARPDPSPAEPVDLAVLPFTASKDPVEARLAAGFGREVNRLLARNRRLSVIASGSAELAAAARPGEERPAAAGAGESAAGDPVADPSRLASLASRLGAAHLLEGGFRWQRDSEVERAEATVRLTRASDGATLWEETLEAFFGEVAGLQERVALEAARRLGAGARPSRRAATGSAGAYQAYLDAVGRSAAAEESRAAEASFELAVQLDPGLLEAHLGLVRSRLAQIGSAGAGESRGEAPRSGASRAGGGAIDDALAAARRALAAARAIDPLEPEVRAAAAELALAQGDAVAALEEYEAALERLPADPGLLHAAALIDRRAGRWEEATARWTAACRRDPLNLELRSELVESLVWTRRFDEAAAEAERFASLLPEAVEPVLLRADLLLAGQGSVEESRALLEAVPADARSTREWQRRMLRLELWAGEYQAALTRLPAARLGEEEELIERAWIHRHMGRAGRAASGFELARDLLDDRLESSPADPWLAVRLAQAYAGTGGPHLAGRMGQRAVGQLPVTSDAVAGAELVERLARTYVLAGDHDHALDELAFLLEIPSPVTVVTLRLDPVWRPLDGEPRFQRLLERFAH